MSLNQSRAEKSESSQYKKLGRSGSSGQPKNFAGGSRKGGGTAPLPSSSSINSSSFPSNRSLKKSNNAQGGQSRVSGASVNAPAACTVQNGANLQPPLHGASDAPVTGVIGKLTDTSAQKSTQAVPKAPSSQSTTVNPDTTLPSTPAKAPGDVSRSFPLQFGSISPGFMNGMQIPARTSSAPPNLDEQKRYQARHDTLRAVPTLPIPSAPKQQLSKKDAGNVGQSNTGEAHPMPTAKRDVQVSSAPPVTQTQKPPVHSITGISMQMPYHQSQLPIQFGGSNPQIQSQGMAASSLPMPMPMPMPLPLPMGNPQVQQQVFVPSLQPHTMQPQGIMHQGQSLNFMSQMGPQLPPQLGNLGVNITPQFPRQQAGKFGGPRKTVKITHPDTHEELRLDKRADTYTESGSSGQRSHPNVPSQSQPIPSFPAAQSINYYPNPYTTSPFFFPPSSSLPLTSTTPSSQAPRFNYPVSRGPHNVSSMNPSALNSFSVNKTGTPLHGIAETSNLEHARDVHNIISSAPSASVQVTVKPAAGSHGEKVADPSLSVISPAVEKGESPKLLSRHGEASSIGPQRDLETSTNSLQQSKHGIEPLSTLLPVGSKQSVAVSASVSAESPAHNSLSSAPSAPLEESVSVVSLGTSSTEGRRRETISRSDSSIDQQRSGDKVGGQSTSISSLPSQSLEHNISFDSTSFETTAAKSTPASSGISGGVLEATAEPLLTTGVTTTDASDSKTDTAGEGSTFESLEMIDAAGIIIDTLDTDHDAGQDNSSQVGKRLKPETVGTKRGETMLPEGNKQDENGFERSLESISSKSSGGMHQPAQNSILKVMTIGNEVGSTEATQRELEESAGCCTEDDMADISMTSISTALDDLTAEAFPLSPDVFTTSYGNNTSTTDTSSSRNISMDINVVTKLGKLDLESAPVLSPSLSEESLRREGEGTENISPVLVSLAESGTRDKPMIEEANRAKSTMAGGKKKRREIFQMAGAAGTTSDLYMAYKGLEEKKETVAPSESTEGTSSSNLKQVPVDISQENVSSEKGGLSNAELDDSEDAADISTPKLETLDNEKQEHGGLKYPAEYGNGVMVKKYSMDFLLKFSEQCTDLPDGLADRSDLTEVLLSSNVTVPRESYPSPGRIIDRTTGGSRPERRGRGMGDDDKWSKLPVPLASGQDLRMDISYGGNVVGSRPGQRGSYGVLRNPGAQTPVQYAGGSFSGLMQSLGSPGGMQRNIPDSDRWQRATAFQKGLIPSPQTPLQVMHKAEKKYEVGKVADEQEAKQRQLKAILNKLTPQNFEKLFEQVKAVNIDNVDTLIGVISQIFDKALMEPTFCEMYANFCCCLAGVLPDFSENNEKITFKRLLLNKCQEEFERGEREQEEANRAEEEGEVKQSEEEREEKRIRARRRMLGNIRLIGELYKKKMLTEKIMHECIKKLLGQYQNPDEEDVEALCKLMSTIGEMIDHPKAKERMDAYFDMIAKLSNNMKLSSRMRFMLKDAIDLRKNKWQQRRKVEGPKKIEEVHRDAAQERQAQASRQARGPSIGASVRRGQPMDFSPRGSNMLSSPNAQMGGFRGLPTQLRGYGTQDVRLEDRHPHENRTLSVSLPQRPVGDGSITLAPLGGLARGMSSRGQMSSIPSADIPGPGDTRRLTTGMTGYSSVSERTAYGSREDLIPLYVTERFVSPSAYDQSSTQERNMNYGNGDLRNADCNFDRSLPTSLPIRGQWSISSQNVSSEKVWPEERLRDKSVAAIKEFYSAKDEKEVSLCIKDLNAPSFYPSMISIWVTDSFERKDMERDLLAKLLINLTKSQDVMLSQDQLIRGFESVLTTLEDAVNDAPKAAEFLGRILAKVILENVIPFLEIAQLIQDGGEVKGRLVEIGLAAEVLGSILEMVRSEKGQSALNEICRSPNFQLEKFRPPDPSKSLRLDKFI